MRILATLYITLISLTTYAQWSIDRGSVSWSHRYDAPWDLATALTAGIIADDRTIEGTIIASLPDIEIDYRGYGMKELTTPMYISRSTLSAVVSIVPDSTGYTVTLTRMRLRQMYDDPLSQAGDITPLDTYALRKGTLSKKWTEKHAPVFHHTLVRWFGM